MWNFQGSWFLAIEFPRCVTQSSRISSGESLLCLEFPRVKDKLKNSRGFFRKVCPQPPCLDNFRNSPFHPAWHCPLRTWSGGHFLLRTGAGLFLLNKQNLLTLIWVGSLRVRFAVGIMLVRIMLETWNLELKGKVVSAIFLLVCFAWLNESAFETRKNVFYFILKALFVLEIIRF